MFCVDDDVGKIRGLRGTDRAIPLKLHWDSDKVLVISYPRRARVIERDKEMRGVSIRFEPVDQESSLPASNDPFRDASVLVVHRIRSRKYWIACLACIIGLGIASRSIHTGWILFDKYLGDALYAAMVYGLLSLVWQTGPLRKAALAMLIMTTLELFQLTMIPAHMLASANKAKQIFARLLGTEFSFRDLLVYGVGILGASVLDRDPSTVAKVGTTDAD